MAPPAPPLQGRAEPLQALRSALDAALAGHGGMALISGEAGIGKSALADALAREAELLGARVLRGRAWEFADAPPYFPVWPVLRALGLEVGADAFELWERVVGALAQRRDTSVWILEDLHAADLGTLDLLTFLTQPLRALGVLVIGTLRSHDPRISERMQRRLGRMAREGLELRLAPLSSSEVAALAEQVLGRGVHPAALERLVELTGGNPLFVLECARALDALGGAESALRALPPTLRQISLERVALLPDSCREALESAAVLGREFSGALLAQLLGTLPARAIDVLLPALRAALITEPRPGHFLFQHVLVRDALEGSLDPVRRSALHERAELALEPLGDTSDLLLERARHALAALGTGDADRALGLAQRATELLEREGAHDRAFELQQRLAEARAAGLLPPPEPEQRLALARLARRVGRSEVSRRECEQVVELARAAGDAEFLARAALLHGADVRPGVLDPQQVAWLEQALEALGSTASAALRCRVRARLATALQPAALQDRPMSLLRAAIEEARSLGDAEVLIDVLEQAGWGLFLAPLGERSALARELCELALGQADIPRALVGHVALAFYALEAGDLVAFDVEVGAALELSDEIGHPRHRWRPLLLASLRASLRGSFAEADRHVTEVEQLAALIDDPALGLTLGVHQLLRRRLRRQDEEVRALCELLPETMREVDGFYVALQRAQCAARLLDIEATRVALAVVQPRLAQHMVEPVELAEAIALAGSDAARREARQALLALGRRDVGGNLMGFDYEGTVPRLLGLLAAGLGDHASAELELREAHALEQERGHAPWVAQTAYELARVLERAGRSAEAERWYTESTELARQLDMPGLARRPEAERAPASGGGREPPLTLTREAGGWRMARGASTLTLKDSRGVQLLAALVARPGEELHVLALTGDGEAGLAESDAGELLDTAARDAYRLRLRELEDELAEAERRSDGARGAKLERERQALLGELRRGLGLGGRARRAGSATERARVNVQRRLKDVVTRVGQLDAELGRFLERSVRTGTYCCFRP